MIPQSSTVFGGMSSFLVVLAMKTLVALHEVSSHLVWPFKVWLILDLLQYLIYWLSEHCVDLLRSHKPRLPSKIPLGFVIIVSVLPEIPPILKDYISLSLPLLLVFLNPFVLFNSVHKLAYTGSRFPSQKLPQTMLGK